MDFTISAVAKLESERNAQESLKNRFLAVKKEAKEIRESANKAIKERTDEALRMKRKEEELEAETLRLKQRIRELEELNKLRKSEVRLSVLIAYLLSKLWLLSYGVSEGGEF